MGFHGLWTQAQPGQLPEEAANAAEGTKAGPAAHAEGGVGAEAEGCQRELEDWADGGSPSLWEPGERKGFISTCPEEDTHAPRKAEGPGTMHRHSQTLNLQSRVAQAALS